MTHQLEPLIDAVAVEAERHPEELQIWAVAAVASKLGLAVLIGEDALPLDRHLSSSGPQYAVELDLGEPGKFYVEGGDVLDVIDGVESIGRAWLGLVEEMCRRHPTKANEMWAAAFGVMAEAASAGRSLDAIEQIGEMWVNLTSQRLDDGPSRQAQTLKAAWRITERLVGAIRARGLTKDQRAPLRR